MIKKFLEYFNESNEINYSDIFPKEDLFNLIKSLKNTRIPLDKLNDEVEYYDTTYNPFDKNFRLKIEVGYYALIIFEKNENNKLEVKIGKNSNWVGGLSFGERDYCFLIDKLSFEDLKNGLLKADSDEGKYGLAYTSNSCR